MIPYFEIKYMEWVAYEIGGTWTEQSVICRGKTILEALNTAINKENIDVNLIVKVEYIEDVSEYYANDNDIPF